MAGAGWVRPDDAELMRRTADGDRAAFAAIYARHHATIYRFARLMTGAACAAEDIVQEVFLAVMREPRRYDPAQASLPTYLYGIARRQTRRRLVRERRFVTLEDTAAMTAPAAGEEAHAALARHGEMERLRKAILSLPSRYREVVVLCELEEQTYADAAAALGCPVGTIRSRLHRARQLLVVRMRSDTGAAKTSRTVAASRVRCAI